MKTINQRVNEVLENIDDILKCETEIENDENYIEIKNNELEHFLSKYGDNLFN